MRRQVIAGLAGLALGIAALADPASAHTERNARHQNKATQQEDLEASEFAARTGRWIQTGTASFYGYGRLSRFTASGAVFDRSAMTAAHAWLPFGTRVRVRDESTGREVLVTITDRLPTRRRVIDLSVGAARELGMLHRGLTVVSLERAV